MELYQTTYKQGRGLHERRFLGRGTKAANNRSFNVFEGRYMDGREPYPWPDVCAPWAQDRARQRAAIGVTSSADSTGERDRVVDS